LRTSASPASALTAVRHDRPAFRRIIFLILQVTLIGWIPATIWSVYALSA
jgi:hypothetical protein